MHYIIEKLPRQSLKSLTKLTDHVCGYEKELYNSFRSTSKLSKGLDDIRLKADDLFSMFTADIIKERQVFTR